jgi:hypothetical protein
MVFSVMLSMVRSFIGGTLIASCAILTVGMCFRGLRVYAEAARGRGYGLYKVNELLSGRKSSKSARGGGVLGGVNWA